MTQSRPPERRISRRSLFASAGSVAGLGLVAAVGVETEVLPGRSTVYGRLGLDGPDGRVPDVEPGPSESGRFVSEARGGQECGWTIARPPGNHGVLPVVVVLHGRGKDHTDAFARHFLALDAFLAAAVRSGVPPFALASVDGGDSYWHARESGEDSSAMVTDEFLPLLAARDLDTTRIGLLGWSMGGFGALLVAAALGADRLAGVSLMSPALFREYGDATPRSFDDEADFEAVTPFGREHEVDGIPLRIDCGHGDPFYGAVREYVDGLDPTPEGGFARGDHDIGYWRRIAPDHLAFHGARFEG